MVSQLSDTWHVLVPDLRGHGETEWAINYGWSSFVEDIAAFAPALGISRYVLFGHSLGGWIGYMVAAAHPEAVRRLIIAETNPPHPWPPDGATAVPPTPQLRSFASPLSRRRFRTHNRISFARQHVRT